MLDKNQKVAILGSIASRLAKKDASASIPAGSEGKKFKENLYSHYADAKLPDPDIAWVSNGSPEEVTKWLSSYIKNQFIFLTSPPIWLGECNWLYLNGYPMRFIGQIKDLNKMSKNSNREVYIFEGRNEANDRDIYRACYQEKDINGEVGFGIDGYE